MNKLVNAALCAGMVVAVGCGSSDPVGPTATFAWDVGECPVLADGVTTAADVAVVGIDAEGISPDEEFVFDCADGDLLTVYDINDGIWDWEGQVVEDTTGTDPIACLDDQADPDCLFYSGIDEVLDFDTLVDPIVDVDFVFPYAYAPFDVLWTLSNDDATAGNCDAAAADEVIAVMYFPEQAEPLFDDEFLCENPDGVQTRDLPVDDYALEFDITDIDTGEVIETVDPLAVEDCDAQGICSIPADGVPGIVEVDFNI